MSQKSLNLIKYFAFLLVCAAILSGCENEDLLSRDELQHGFRNPPRSAYPGVYWYFMDGNLSRKEMTADLESMEAAGIRHLVFLEVNVGIPRGPVDMLSGAWQDLFEHAVREAERLGIEITLGIGPGWTGSGGPWVKPEKSMKHLVASETNVQGPGRFTDKLPVPAPRRPYFGEAAFTEELKEQWLAYYEDVCVLAFPTPATQIKIADSDEKALYYRAPYSSRPGVKPFLPMPVNAKPLPPGSAVQSAEIIDLTDRLQTDGTLDWEIPAGSWTIMRFVQRNNGAITRPAPVPGLGFECDKFDRRALDEHFDAYVGRLLKRVKPIKAASGGGWTMLHMDSWEMGAQNWTAGFRRLFKSRCGYDPQKYLPAYTGCIIDDRELTERFLWDVRKTAQELVLENHAGYVKELGRKYHFGLSIEPYDMNPCSDLDLGAVADVPMCEFWSLNYGFNTAYSCIEATSIAHINGRAVVAAESFTANQREAWQLYPGAMKNQSDWALCMGINRFFYHTFAHKPLGDRYRPGMTMGPYGVHWDRGQTWWPFVSAYHRYIARCSYLLQQGNTVADILYLTPEGAPQVFLPPRTALTGNDTIPDRRGYNFDGCSPEMLIQGAAVKDKKIIFSGGASYHLLVLPAIRTMTPELIEKIESLAKNGATIIGTPPLQSPSLVNYPLCDDQVARKAEDIWGTLQIPAGISRKNYGKGQIIWGGEISRPDSGDLYPSFELTADILRQKAIGEDFSCQGPLRYTHRRTSALDIYYVSNRTEGPIETVAQFRVSGALPERWDPLSGEFSFLPEYNDNGEFTSIPLQFDAYQSYFIVFEQGYELTDPGNLNSGNLPDQKQIKTITGPWQVTFDPVWGGPSSVTFEKLMDWTTRPEEGIRYYSGRAVYHNTFDLPATGTATDRLAYYLDLGEVNHVARVSLNGRLLGIVWTAPWRVDISKAVRQKDNHLAIEVVNLWPNRLIGDARFPDDGIKDGQWPAWLKEGRTRNSKRLSFTTYQAYQATDPLIKSGLIGPVRLTATAE